MKRYSQKDLEMVLREMADYAQYNGEEIRTLYLDELSKCGLFHDAIGKVCGRINSDILVKEEY